MKRGGSSGAGRWLRGAERGSVQPGGSLCSAGSSSRGEKKWGQVRGVGGMGVETKNTIVHRRSGLKSNSASGSGAVCMRVPQMRRVSCIARSTPQRGAGIRARHCPLEWPSGCSVAGADLAVVNHALHRHKREESGCRSAIRRGTPWGPDQQPAARALNNTAGHPRPRIGRQAQMQRKSQRSTAQHTRPALTHLRIVVKHLARVHGCIHNVVVPRLHALRHGALNVRGGIGQHHRAAALCLLHLRERASREAQANTVESGF